MKISVLTDNSPGTYTRSEHGLSFFIEQDDKRILFDTGQSDLFIKNASVMGIDIYKTDRIILSHGHFDHGNGLDYLTGGDLLCHPGCFVQRFRKKDNSRIGLKNTWEEINQKFNLVVSETPVKLSEKIIFLGEIPRITEFESKKTPFIFEDGTPDYVSDDSALAFLLPEGLFVVTGCGHSGIVNILEHARKITGEHRIFGIMGGFHLKDTGWQTQETIQYLKSKGVKHIYPSHCTGLPALSAFYNHFKCEQVKTGCIYSF